MFEYLIIGWAAILGLIMGHALSRAASRKLVRQARMQAEQQLEEANEGARMALDEAGARAREDALVLLRAGEEQEAQLLEDNARLEERLAKLDSRCERQEANVARLEEELQRRQQALSQGRAEAAAVRQAARDSEDSGAMVVEEKAGTSAAQLMQVLVEQLVEEHRALCSDRLRNLESSDTEEFTRQAKRLMGIAMGRFNGKLNSERQGAVIHLTAEARERLTQPPGALSIIEQETGVHLATGENGDSLRMETNDGVARELVRRCVARFSSEDRVQDPARLIRNISDNLKKEIRGKGLEAFKVLGLKPAHDEIVDLVGRLAYRTSYTQNQWEHTIEASFLAGLLAGELGLDVLTARRATLLHDIGKALSHEMEGSHAVIGAELARKHGEPELVANAVGAHHGDEPMNSPYAPLVAAADAMSGARPGARREMVETYGDRIGDLERIAARFPGVEMVHAVQAGREIRVHVNEKRVSDQKATQIADQIAAKISEEMTFPGQIRVIVIREFRATELAS